MPFPPTLPPTNPGSPLADLRSDHVALRVPDFEAGIRWFIEKLDFRLAYRWPTPERQLAHLVSANDDSFRLEIVGVASSGKGTSGAAEQGVSPQPALGFHHFCLSVANVAATVDELRRRGVSIVREPFVLEAIDCKVAFVADPWGNLIELLEAAP